MTISRIWLGAMGLALIASQAMAADFGGPRRATQDAYVEPAPAANYSWTGCRVGGQLGHANADTNSGFIGVDGYVYGVMAGCDIQIKQLVIGALADYDWSNINQLNIGTSAKEWSFGGRAGILVTPTTLVYALVTRPELTFKGVTLDGFGMGGGIETAITKNWRIALEYRHEDFSGAPLPSGFTLNTDQVMTRLTFGFDVPVFK